jgi:membrane fusion protein
MTGTDNHLFRGQVIESQRKRLFGEIVLTESRGNTLATYVLCLCIALLVAWAFVGKYSRKEEVVGTVVTDIPEVNILANKVGVLKNLRVREGEAVKAGEPLGFIATEIRDENLVDINANVRSALINQRNEGIDKRSKLAISSTGERERLSIAFTSAEDRYQSLNKQVKIQTELVDSLKKTLDRIEPLLETSYISKIDFERRRQEVLSANQRLEEILQSRSESKYSVESARSQLKSQSNDFDLQLSQSRMESENVEREIAKNSGDLGYVVTSPISGIVTAIQASSERTVDARYPLLTVRPHKSKFEVELLAPTRAVGFLKIGQQVDIMYDAFPYRQFGVSKGTISGMSDSAISAKDLDSPLDIREPVYKIKVRLSSQAVNAFNGVHTLHGGMTVKANLILERKSFIDWILEPVNAVRMRQ